MEEINNKKPKRILVVDDNEMVRGIYADIFKNSGFEVEEAEDGLEGLEKATATLPDIIFTGIIMPRMEGFDLMEALKKNATTSQIPVFISSHLGREEDKKKAFDLGAKDFFIKDFDTPNEVVARVRDFFENGFYELQIKNGELDATRFSKEVLGSENFQCPNCKELMILKIKVADHSSKKITGRVICPKCDLK